MKADKTYTKKEYKRLLKEVEKHDELYYQDANPIISDYAYDHLIKEIEIIEDQHPDWVAKDSPTQKVGGSVQSGFKQVAHNTPMLSLANTYSEEEILQFTKRVEKLLNTPQVSYAVDIKIDGVAASIHYDKGQFVRGVTRGDGKKGDDVTQNMQMIQNLPHSIPFKGSMELRGEVYMSLEVFQKLNQKKQEMGLDVYANPRNAAAGSLKLLDSQEVKNRELSILLYDVVDSSVDKQSEVRSFLAKQKLPTFSTTQTAVCHNVDEILDFAKTIEQKRHEFPFELDGIVIKVDELSTRKSLGATGKHPRWAVAYKFAPEQAETLIEDITIGVGRTGVLTPVAELKPVQLAGSRISRATLHNADEVARKDIRIGDYVIIEKGGDVIPKVSKVILDKRPSGLKVWHMPNKCPSCSSSVVHHPGEVAVRCPNPHCPAKNARKIEFFVGKGAMDIENLGTKVVEKLIENQFIQTFSDIYKLNAEKLATLEGFKQKSIDNLLRSIEKSKNTTLARFIFALGIPFVGVHTAELIAEHIKSIDNFFSLTEGELQDIPGIGPKASESVIEYLQDSNHKKEIQELLKLGVHPKSMKKTIQDHAFQNKTFVLTGTLQNYSREEAGSLIKERGGKVTGSISTKTDYLLLGENPGSKYDKAKKLSVSIMTEQEFTQTL